MKEKKEKKWKRHNTSQAKAAEQKQAKKKRLINCDGWEEAEKMVFSRRPSRNQKWMSDALYGEEITWRVKFHFVYIIHAWQTVQNRKHSHIIIFNAQSYSHHQIHEQFCACVCLAVSNAIIVIIEIGNEQNKEKKFAQIIPDWDTRSIL